MKGNSLIGRTEFIADSWSKAIEKINVMEEIRAEDVIQIIVPNSFSNWWTVVYRWHK